jgi:hypothetical protein
MFAFGAMGYVRVRQVWLGKARLCIARSGKAGEDRHG